MTAPISIDPARFLHDQMESASPDLLRSMLTTFINALMSAEADAVCGDHAAVRGPLPARAVRLNRGHEPLGAAGRRVRRFDDRRLPAVPSGPGRRQRTHTRTRRPHTSRRRFGPGFSRRKGRLKDPPAAGQDSRTDVFDGTNPT